MSSSSSAKSWWSIASSESMKREGSRGPLLALVVGRGRGKFAHGERKARVVETMQGIVGWREDGGLCWLAAVEP
jgi:hypothetical protein